MCGYKIYFASSIRLLALLLLAWGCNPSQQPNTPPPPANDTAVDTVGTKTVPSAVVPQQSDHTFIVEINHMKFNPDQLLVHRGDTVVWVNNDLTNHCVTETNKAWTSSTLQPGKFWMKVITNTTDYFCAIHLVMKGKVQVE